MASLPEEGIAGLQRDLLRQMNRYTAQQSLAGAARLAMMTTVTETWEKAEAEYRSQDQQCS